MIEYRSSSSDQNLVSLLKLCKPLLLSAIVNLVFWVFLDVHFYLTFSFFILFFCLYHIFL